MAKKTKKISDNKKKLVLPKSSEQYKKAISLTEKPEIRKEIYSRYKKAKKIQYQDEATKVLLQSQPVNQRIVRNIGQAITFRPETRRAFNPQVARFEPPTKAQQMFQEIIGNGERTWGTGQNLPRMNRALSSGNGIIKSGDVYRETGSMFGLR